MYLGMAILLLAWGIYLDNPGNFLVFCLYIAFMTRFQIKPEELALAKLFGEKYEAYQSQVRRWL